jgi:hypothetical protein
MRPDVLGTMAVQHGLITRRQAIDCGLDTREVDRLVRTRIWVAVRRGVYAEARFVAGLTTRRAQRLLRDRAASLRISMPHVMSHDSAADELGLDILDPPTACTHVTRPGVVGSHLRHGVKHHLAPYDGGQVVEVNGRRALDPARTAADIAREHGEPFGVVAMDSALRAGTARSAIARAIDAMAYWPHVNRARTALDLADPGSDSVAETLGRELVTELGHGRPQTQLGLSDGGRTVFCDLRLDRHVFEVDGRVKYRPVADGGLAVVAPEQVLAEEKSRQDFVCGFKLGMSRIVWADYWGVRREMALRRFEREYLDTCARFGTSIEDLAPYLVRRPLRRSM